MHESQSSTPTSRRRRRAVSALTTVGCAFVIAACGSSSKPSSAARSGGYTQAVKYSQCIRAHGVSDYPDPTFSSSGNHVSARIPVINPAEIDSPAFKSAQAACRGLEPNGADAAQQGQSETPHLLAFAACMRDHGVPDFPDPDRNGQYPSSAMAHIDRGAPLVRAALKTCIPTAQGALELAGTGSG